MKLTPQALRELVSVFGLTRVHCQEALESLSTATKRELAEALANEPSSAPLSVAPPAFAGNVETRATATKHFQETRRILRGIR